MTNRPQLPVIYVAGKYRAKHESEVFANIMTARKFALGVWRAGAVAICPHLNTMFFGGAVAPENIELDGEIWLAGDLELLRRCDAIYMLPGWESSRGATVEREIASSLGIPDLRCDAELQQFVTKFRGSHASQ